MKSREMPSLQQIPISKVTLSDKEMSALLELRYALERIAEELRPEIEAGEYKIIIGDDVSGRIPTLMMRRILRKTYAAHGIAPPLIGHVACQSGQNSIYRQKLEAYVRYLKERIVQTAGTPGKVLVVTDTICSGLHLGPLHATLAAEKWGADTATMGDYMGGGIQEKLAQKWSGKIVSGRRGTPGIYRKSAIAGVFKKADSPFALPRKWEHLNNGMEIPIVHEARRVALRIVDEIMEPYLEATKDTFAGKAP